MQHNHSCQDLFHNFWLTKHGRYLKTLSIYFIKIQNQRIIKFCRKDFPESRHIRKLVRWLTEVGFNCEKIRFKNLYTPLVQRHDP